jgi:hypothetical protein
MAVSDYLAVLALLISAISLYISWRQYSRDRSHLKLSLDIEEDVTRGPAFMIQVVNAGRRQATVVRGYARVSSGKRYPVFDTQTVLEETDSLQFKVYFADFFRTFSSKYYIQAFEVEDTMGRRSTVSTRPLKNKIKKCLAEVMPPTDV